MLRKLSKGVIREVRHLSIRDDGVIVGRHSEGLVRVARRDGVQVRTSTIESPGRLKDCALGARPGQSERITELEGIEDQPVQEAIDITLVVLMSSDCTSDYMLAGMPDYTYVSWYCMGYKICEAITIGIWHMT